MDNDRVTDLPLRASSDADAIIRPSARSGGHAGGTLIEDFDGVVCDLDGVVYRGHRAMPHAVEALLSALSGGVLVVYATNNASRTPAEVAAHLDALGLPGPASRVVTSAQAAARHVAQCFPPGSRVMAVGGQGVALALKEVGLVPVSSRLTPTDEPVVAVVQGYGSNVDWTDLAEVAYAVQAGALWVATNIDETLPTERGVAPGNGALVSAVRCAVSVDPVVVGKPYTPLYDLSASVLGTSIGRTLAIGDRLDTDIRGANAAGMDSLFVFGGVHGWSDLAAADPIARPRFVATDLRSLFSAYSEPVEVESNPERFVCGGAQAWISAVGDLVVSPAGELSEKVRAAARALWNAADRGGAALDPRAGDGAKLSRELDMNMADGR